METWLQITADIMEIPGSKRSFRSCHLLLVIRDECVTSRQQQNKTSLEQDPALVYYIYLLEKKERGVSV